MTAFFIHISNISYIFETYRDIRAKKMNFMKTNFFIAWIPYDELQSNFKTVLSFNPVSIPAQLFSVQALRSYQAKPCETLYSKILKYP